MHSLTIINGPNLNLLGTREPAIYGANDLETLTQQLQEIAQKLGLTLSFFQSNHEGELIDYIHQLSPSYQGAIINAGALTHTSIGLRDALLARALPFIEVHLSNIWAREPFRHHSYLADIALGVISGLGPIVYELALRAFANRLENGFSSAQPP